QEAVTEAGTRIDQLLDLLARECLGHASHFLQLQKACLHWFRFSDVMKKAFVATACLHLSAIEGNSLDRSHPLMIVVKHGDSSQDDVDGRFTSPGKVLLHGNESGMGLSEPRDELSQFRESDVRPFQFHLLQ